MNNNNIFLEYFVQSISAFQQSKIKKIIKIYNKLYQCKIKNINQMHLIIKKYINIKDILFVGDTVLFVSDLSRIYWFCDNHEINSISALILLQYERKYCNLYIFHLDYSGTICSIIKNYSSANVTKKEFYVKPLPYYNINNIVLSNGKIYGEIPIAKNTKSAKNN